MEKHYADTREHIGLVRDNLHHARAILAGRELLHDSSKLSSPEDEGFAAMAEEIAASDLEYGSDEYRVILKKYKESTIDHHYEANDHHPEHFENGIAGMSLFAQIEMLCDWQAAGQRYKDSTFAKSFALNVKRFKMTPEQESSLRATAIELGFM